MEKIYWSPYEDSILLLLREQRKMQRWTDIARTLATEFQIKGRNGKHCRQRYQERFDSSTETSIWSYEEQKTLFSLHNELGNKWAIISRKMNGRSDNCIKNHFYSRLRKGLKKMNQVAEEFFEKRFKQIKFNVLFKIIEATEDGYKNNVFCQVDTSKRCFEIKNKLIVLSYDDQEDHDLQPENINCVELYEDIINFNKNYKRKPKKFRRIPTKSSDLKQRQNSYEDVDMKSTHSDIESSNDADEEQNKMEEEVSAKEKRIPSIKCVEIFGEYEQEFYKINEYKNSKKRRESAQTTGIQQILGGSGIIEQEPQLPLLGLTKKGTSFFSFMNEEPKHENIFFDEYELNSECFMLKDLMSLKRISHNESRLFD